MATANILNNIISAISNSTKKPEDFLSVQEKTASLIKDSIKCLYDFTKEKAHRNTNALPELVTEGFDEEQIWQQLELQNEGELVYFLTGISKVLAGNKKFTIPITIKTSEPGQEEDLAALSIKEVEGSTELSDNDSSSDEAEVDSEDVRKWDKKVVKKKKRKSSIVDDKFFKLQELDEYLTNVEKQERQGDKGDNELDESDDTAVDFFNNDSDHDSEASEDGRFLKYADFFDNPESENEIVDHKNMDDLVDLNEDNIEGSGSEHSQDGTADEEDQRSTKRVKFNLTNDSDETDSLENKNDRLTAKERQLISSLESRQERLRERIRNLEHEALSEKPWQLRGEVSATGRPQNSLLEEFVEFDVTTRPAPVITEQTTLKLEDIIKQRIRDKAWDDVAKKFKPIETPLEYKKKLVLDQEKSKESLAQIYENEYLKQKRALDPATQEQEEEEPELHKDVRQMMHSLFCKLDALSNFHYTPKPAIPELKIVSNVPAISMEEVTPVAVSDATLLAPEEIKGKLRGDLIGKSERTSTDMRRERRHKKERQRDRQKARADKEKMNALKPGLAKKQTKQRDAALIKKLTHDRNITKLDEAGRKMPRSSSAFFGQLQDQVKSYIKAKASNTTTKQNKKTASAIKLKL